MTRPKRALVSGYIGFSNFGDEAVLSALSFYLKENGLEVTAFSCSPKETELAYGIKALKFNNPFAILKGILNCDILFSGGGSLLQNSTSSKSLYYYLAIIFLAFFTGKKVVIFAQGIGPLKGLFPTLLTKYTLKCAKLVTVRDSQSLALLKKWKISASLVCDPVWGIKLPEYNSLGYVGIQLRPYKHMDKHFLQRLAQCVADCFKDKKIQIFSFQNAQDAQICYKFQTILKDVAPDIDSEVIVRSSINELVQDFSSLEYLIAMRFHACLLGLKYGIKTLPVSYDNKVKALSDEFGIKYICADCDTDFSSMVKELKISDPNMHTQQRVKMSFDWSIYDNIVVPPS